MFRSLTIAFLAIAAVSASARAGSPRRRAMLVGCTFYPDLPKNLHLSGCGNDATLMRDMLQDKRFGFKPEDMEVLTEETGAKDEKLLPTRANIMREFDHLAAVSGPGDTVVIFLAGHGSQQPSEHPDDPENPEPDGLDEIFLPADVKGWDHKAKKVTNAIVDKEIAVKLKAIRAKGANLVVIIDACQSATLVRGEEPERPRGIPVDKLIPEEALREAKARAERLGVPRKRGQEVEPPFKMGGQAPDFVALYAAQSVETTPEALFPPQGEHRRYHGLFTYTLVKVLTQSAKPLTYTELIQRVQAEYIRTRTSFPLPLVEGKDRDREFLGDKEWPGRSRFTLSRHKGEDGWFVSAGSLHGITPGSILAVYPKVGSPGDDKVVGHVKVVSARIGDAKVEPVAANRMPAPKELPDEGRCEVVISDQGDLKLRVGVDANVPASMRGRLEKASREEGSLLAFQSDLRQAQWIVGIEGDELYLRPAGEDVLRGINQGRGDRRVRLISNTRDLTETDPAYRLTRIARAQNLLHIAAAAENEGEETLKMTADLVRFPESGPCTLETAIPIIWSDRGLALTAGDRFAVRLHNESLFPVWATCLFVDSEFKILPFYPPQGTGRTQNRIAPGGFFLTPRARVTTATLGLEHMVVIAVKARNDKDEVDFRCLCEPTLLGARSTSESNLTLQSPLGRLFQTALYGQGDERGYEQSTLDDYGMRLISFRTLDTREYTPPPRAKVRAIEEAPSTTSAPTVGPTAAVPVESSGQPSWMTALYVAVGVVAGGLAVWLVSRRRASK